MLAHQEAVLEKALQVMIEIEEDNKEFILYTVNCVITILREPLNIKGSLFDIIVFLNSTIFPVFCF